MTMRITEVATYRRDFKLSNPSVIAYESTETAPNVIIRIETESGLIGWGNAAPDEYVTGETAASVEHTINARFREVLLEADASRIESIWSQLSEVAPNQPSAIAAIDIALYDLLGKVANLPLHQLLGHARDELITSVTLSIEQTRISVERAREFQSRGFRALKIKCGLDARTDIERVRAIRAAVGNQMWISLDANQGYTVEDSLQVVETLRDCDIAFIEQPVAAADLEALRKVCALSPIPVMADESVLDAKDILKTPAPLVNLKLMKSAGITGALKASAVAEARGIHTMIGCMDESRISMAAAAHVALALKKVIYADLDGHLDLVDDVARDGLTIVKGVIRVGDGAGLGAFVEL